MVYLFREHSHPGRCVVSSKFHVPDMTELSAEQRSAFIEDCALVSRAIKSVFPPAKVNYGAFDDKGGHLHLHLVPKYVDEFEWGGTFQMNSHIVDYTDEMCKPVAEKIKNAIEELVK